MKFVESFGVQLIFDSYKITLDIQVISIIGCDHNDKEVLPSKNNMEHIKINFRFL
jgi:hypothetical protein